MIFVFIYICSFLYIRPTETYCYCLDFLSTLPFYSTPWFLTFEFVSICLLHGGKCMFLTLYYQIFVYRLLNWLHFIFVVVFYFLFFRGEKQSVVLVLYCIGWNKLGWNVCGCQRSLVWGIYCLRKYVDFQSSSPAVVAACHVYICQLWVLRLSILVMNSE